MEQRFVALGGKEYPAEVPTLGRRNMRDNLIHATKTLSLKVALGGTPNEGVVVATKSAVLKLGRVDLKCRYAAPRRKPTTSRTARFRKIDKRDVRMVLPPKGPSTHLSGRFYEPARAGAGTATGTALVYRNSVDK